MFVALLFMTACGSKEDNKISDKVNEPINNMSAESEDVLESTDDIDDIEQVSHITSDFVLDNMKTVPFQPENAFDYIDTAKCVIDKSLEDMTFNFEFAKGIPDSDDDNIYLFEFETYEAQNTEGKKPIAAVAKVESVTFTIPYEEKYLFLRFAPAILFEGEYVLLTPGKNISNPEILSSSFGKEAMQIDSKKGLLLDANTIKSDLLTDLNVKRVVFNIPLSLLMGESENSECPTVEFDYNGQKYLFNGYRLAGYDSLFAYLTEEGYHVTAIVLNDWNNKYPEMIHPLSRRKTSRSMYYAFNDAEEDGVKLIEATAKFLAKRYNSGEYGLVNDWVIANEINQQKIWNYMGTADLDFYVDSFEKTFRIFYNAIKSENANSKVYFSIDQDWNNNAGYNGFYFNGRDLMYAFNETAKEHGDYDWSLSIHPYPNPLPKVQFWKGDFDKTETAKVVTPMNLSVVTDMMQLDEFLNPDGKVRNIGITELGFSSKAGEKYQAAAFAYCYYIIKDNQFIDSFLLNRQTDDLEALKSGLALGIYNNDYSKKILADVFANIDSNEGNKYIPEMLEIIGAGSLEEALEWAR